MKTTLDFYSTNEKVDILSLFRLDCFEQLCSLRQLHVLAPDPLIGEVDPVDHLVGVRLLHPRHCLQLRDLMLCSALFHHHHHEYSDLLWAEAPPHRPQVVLQLRQGLNPDNHGGDVGLL